MTIDESAIIAVLDRVPDPEIPVLSILDLGIVREITQDPPRVLITPTYTGCPATLAIEEAIRDALDAAGFGHVFVERCCSRRGPPTGSASAGASASRPMASPRRRRRDRECPQCGSTDTEEVSRFGSTPCKAQWRCKACLEPFDRFKCH